MSTTPAPRPRIWLLAWAYLSRIVREARLLALVPPALLTLVLLVPLVAESLLPADLLNGTRPALALAAHVLHMAPSPLAFKLGSLLLLGPTGIALATAIGGALGVRGFVSEELSSGGFETALATGWRPRQLAVGLLCASWALVGGYWALSSALAALIITMVAIVGSAGLHLGAGYLTVSLLAPLLVALGGITLAVVLAMLFPGLARSGFGASIWGGDVVSLVATLPALALIFGFLLTQGALHPVLLGALLGTVGLGVVALVLLRAVRAERLLTSTS